MAYSFSYPNETPYKNPQNFNYSNQQKTSVLPGTLTGAAIGAGTGALIGYKKGNFVNKQGEFSDNFVKNTFENYMNNDKNIAKNLYQERLNILKKIDSIKNTEDLKKLFEANKQASESFHNELKQSSEKYFNKITESNLEANKKIIKDKLTSDNKVHYQDVKNQIQACWNKDKKAFTKTENINEELYNSIKKTKNNIKSRSTGKFALIGSIVAGILSFIGLNLLIK